MKKPLKLRIVFWILLLLGCCGIAFIDRSGTWQHFMIQMIIIMLLIAAGYIDRMRDELIEMKTFR